MHANPMILACLGHGISHALVSAPKAGIPCLFLINFPNCPGVQAFGIWPFVIDPDLANCCILVCFPTDFRLGATREVCTVIEYVDNQLILQMSAKSPLASSHVNNSTVPVREKGGGVAGSSAQIFDL